MCRFFAVELFLVVFGRGEDCGVGGDEVVGGEGGFEEGLPVRRRGLDWCGMVSGGEGKACQRKLGGQFRALKSVNWRTGIQLIVYDAYSLLAIGKWA